MKKLLYLFPLLILIVNSSNSYSQETYLKLNPFYAFSIHNRTFTEEWSVRYNFGIDKVIDERNVISNSLGEGYGLQLTVGRTLNPHLGFELSASYLKGTPLKTENKLRYYADEDLITNTYKSSLFSITPSLLFQHQIGNNLLYMKSGLIIGIPRLKREAELNAWNDDHLVEKYKYTGGVSAGMNITLGVELTELTENISLFAEFSWSALSFKPKSRETYFFEYNGHDSLSTLNQSELLTEYSEEYSIEYIIADDGSLEEYVDPDEPRQAGKYDIPFGNFGINFGVRFSLSGKKEKEESLF